jgi:hypothetical protein
VTAGPACQPAAVSAFLHKIPPLFNFDQRVVCSLDYRSGMIGIEEALREATMSPDEIVLRFKKLFGREMTAKEREIFFLSPVSPKHNHS